MKEQIERVAVKDEYKWDLTPIYKNDDLWYKTPANDCGGQGCNRS